jgi:FkbM family methyltransferase
MGLASRLTAIPNTTRLGRLLRLPTRLLPRSMRVRILSGGNRGYWWTVGASHHACWVGNFEEHRQRALAQVLQAGDCFLDVGAHSGFFTLLGSRLVGPKGRVVAFEPLPANLHFLRLHMEANHLENVTLIDAAVSDSEGVAFFAEGANTHTGELSPKGEIRVRTVTLDELQTQGHIPAANVIKIDVEGAEMRVLRGAEQVLKHPKTRAVLLSGHGVEIARECAELLTRAGYSVSELPQYPGAGETELLCLRTKS